NVELVVRPEAVTLGAPGTGVLQGRVTERAYLGAVAEYTVEVGALALMATVANPLEKGLSAPGDLVGIDFPLQLVHILRQEG
ncbi:MAG: TOBE domain-containing protein, partial [Firmicutes bacterium]|nr:TOBE domain-containing protein [Bacillota bacterium]